MAKSPRKRKPAARTAKPLWHQAAASSCDSHRARQNFERFFAAHPLQKQISSPEQTLTQLAAVFASSQSLSETLIQHPDYLPWLLATDLTKPLGKNILQFELAAAVGDAETDAEIFASVRRFKRRQFLRIGLRDLAQLATIEETTREISDLTDVLLDAVYQVALASLAKKFGAPLGPQGEPATFAILGMGKLGGQELNYSSDVDVIFVYSEDGGVRSPSGKQTAMTNEEFFTRLAEAIVAAVGKVTDEGCIYRIDLRLRPEGSSGPLVRSLESCEYYYAALGETWERLALLKARPIAGDEQLGAQFLKMVEPFVFRRYGGEGVLRDMANIKARIEREIVKANALTRHVKLGIGGIREIEFILQALQVLHGGRRPEIRAVNTLRGLDTIAQAGLLPPRDANTLADAYKWLRAVEHRLQMEADLQTHTIPDENAALQRLARSLGFRTISAFKRNESAHTSKVRRIYHQLLASAEPSKTETERATFFGPSRGEPDEAFLNALTRAGFSEPAAAAAIFAELCYGPGFGHISAQTTERFVKLIPKIFSLARTLAEPDAALRQLARFVERYGSRSALYDAFSANPRLLELLLKLFDHSRALGEELLQFPELFDDVVRGGALAQTKDIQTMSEELRAAVTSQSSTNSAAVVRDYKRAEFVRIALADILGLADVEWTCTEFSFLAEATLRFAAESCARELGLPSPPVAIIALGKFGGQELGYGADLDVLLVASDETTAPRFAEKLTEFMSKATSDGIIFKLDFRLRPDGDQGPLTPSLAACRAYYTSRAWTWEKQSLTKARVVAGDADTGRAFMDLVGETIYAHPLNESEFGEIRAMRQRIAQERSDRTHPELNFKIGAGGMMDIEFAVQTLQLRHGYQHASLRCTPTLGALTRLAARGLLEEADQYWLRHDYIFLRRVECALRRYENAAISALPREEMEQKKIAMRLGYSSRETFWRAYQQVRERVHKLCEKLMDAE